jgi:hypothetical protein
MIAQQTNPADRLQRRLIFAVGLKKNGQTNTRLVLSPIAVLAANSEKMD